MISFFVSITIAIVVVLIISGLEFLADYLITKNTYMTGRNICVDGGKSLS